MKTLLPDGDLLTWEPGDNGMVRGFAVTHRRITLFLIAPTDGGKVNLTGAIVPDDEERVVLSVETAKYHAEKYWRAWLTEMCVPHVAFLASPLLETLREAAQNIHDATGKQLAAEAQCEVTVHCGGLTSVRYLVSCGDVMAKGVRGRRLAFGTSPHVATAELLDELDRDEVAMKIREAFLRARAAEMGFELVRKKGAK